MTRQTLRRHSGSGVISPDLERIDTGRPRAAWSAVQFILESPPRSAVYSLMGLNANRNYSPQLPGGIRTR